MQLMCAAMGVWTAYLLCVLYNEYNSRKQAAGELKNDGRVTQYHEVMPCQVPCVSHPVAGSCRYISA